MSKFFSVRTSREMGTCHCEADGCPHNGDLRASRTRTFLLTKDEFDQIPENPISSEVMRFLFHEKIGKPVCKVCRQRLRDQSHIIMDAFSKPEPVGAPDDQATEAPAGTS